MIINHKNLVGLPVETKNGLLLGKIKSFEIDSDTQTVLRYVVKSRSLISKLLSEEVSEIIVGRNQVISIDEEKMIVHDTLVKEISGGSVLQGAKKNAPVLGSRLSISKIDGECTK